MVRDGNAHRNHSRVGARPHRLRRVGEGDRRGYRVLARYAELHALEHPALQHIGPNCLFGKGYALAYLERLALTLRLDQRTVLSRPEEFFLCRGGALYQWIDGDGGTPFASAARALLKLTPPAPFISALANGEAILERIFASLWDDDVETRYMAQPRSVPFEIGSLGLAAPVQLTKQFRTRWGIHSLCLSDEPAVTPDLSVTVRLDDCDESAKTTRWKVCWRWFQEFVTWAYTVEQRAGELCVDRELLEQCD